MPDASKHKILGECACLILECMHDKVIQVIHKTTEGKKKQKHNKIY